MNLCKISLQHQMHLQNHAIKIHGTVFIRPSWCLCRLKCHSTAVWERPLSPRLFLSLQRRKLFHFVIDSFPSSLFNFHEATEAKGLA